MISIRMNDCRRNAVQQSAPDPAPPMPSGHILTLDGLRGVAILLVMLCHFLGLLHTGNHRLDALLHLGFGTAGSVSNLFFVLSGFLITGILLDAKNSPHYFRNFYARRTLRIFPLYYGVLFVCFAILPLLPGSGSEEFAQLRSRQGWLWAYCTTSRSCSTAIGSSPRRCSTSGISGLWPSRSISISSGRCWFCSCRHAAWSKHASESSSLRAPPDAVGLTHASATDTKLLSAYILTPMRMDELAMGALLAALVRSPIARVKLSRYALPALALAAVLLVVNLALPYLLHRQTLLQTAGYTAISLFFVCLLSATIFAASAPSSLASLALRCSGGSANTPTASNVFNSNRLPMLHEPRVAYWIHRYCPSFVWRRFYRAWWVLA